MTSLHSIHDVALLSVEQIRELQGEELRRAVLLCYGWTWCPAGYKYRARWLTTPGHYSNDNVIFDDDSPNPVLTDSRTMDLIRIGSQRFGGYELADCPAGHYAGFGKRDGYGEFSVCGDASGDTIGLAVCRAFVLTVMAERQGEN
jgi:hypothetical protein